MSESRPVGEITNPCTCGSGAHPRPCKKHPKAFDEHVREINEEMSEQ